MGRRVGMGDGGWSSAPLALVLAAGLVVACTIEQADVRTPGGEAPEADTADVRRLIEVMGGALSEGALSVLDTIFHDSVTVHRNGSVVVGWRRYRDDHLLPGSQGAERDVRFQDVQVWPSDNTAWATARYRVTASGEDGRVLSRGGATLIFRRLGGRWRLVHLHMSGRPSEAGPG